jgi:hypothetical protein
VSIVKQEMGILKQENTRQSHELGIVKQENVRLIAAAGVLEKLVKATNPMQVKWRLTGIAAKLREAAVDLKCYDSPRFDVFFHGGHKLYIQAEIQGNKLGVYLYKDIRLSDDKSNLDIVGTSITVTKAGLPARKYTFPLEKPLVLDNETGWGCPKLLSDVTRYIDNDAIYITINLNLNKDHTIVL